MRKSLLSRYSTDFGNLVSRRNTERALRTAAMEAALANRAKTAFLANMSHELRTPLNAIIGFSDLIRHIGTSSGVQNKSAEYADHISRAGHRLLSILCDILDISKIESNTLTLNLECHALQDTINDCAQLVRERIATKFQTFEIDVPKSVPQFHYDETRVKQILLNLLSNASKFTPESGEIALRVAEDDRDVVIIIADTGVGMTEEEIEVALVPFGQAKSAYSRDHDGTGLGLPIARALARQHGGSLSLKSEPGVGTRATLTLPRHRDLSAPGTSPHPHRVTEGPTP